MKIKKSHVSVYLLVLILSLTIVGTVNQSLTPKYNLETPKTSAGEINIVTPENKTYTEPDDGYYPGTYGFENDKDGSAPDEWGYRLTVPQGDSYVKIIPSLDGHEKVLDLNKGNTYGSHLLIYHNFSDKEFGTIEFWLRTTDVTEATEFILRNRNNDASFCAIGVGGQGLGSNFTVYTSGGWQSLPYPANNNKWYHIRFQFECGTGNHYSLDQFFFRLYIDGLEIGNYSFGSNQSKADQIVILQNWLYDNYHSYFDAISFSWDLNYNVGDNLNEGLLLSYGNTTSLDWQGYSLDGQANKTILGNTTIPMPADGLHKVQVFGNDSVGTMYESDLRYFSVFTDPPGITINSPADSELFGTSAPSFDISIAGPYDSIWYALEGSVTNYTANGLSGTIDQTAWSALSDGIITIDFYANNSAGMEGTAQVMVIKDSSEEPRPAPPGIPGYDLYLLIGALSVISAILIRKRVKS